MLKNFKMAQIVFQNIHKNRYEKERSMIRNKVPDQKQKICSFR
jgi:hypothetical protein